MSESTGPQQHAQELPFFHFTNANQILHLLVTLVSSLKVEEVEAEALNEPLQSAWGRTAKAGTTAKQLLRAKCRSGGCR